MSINEKLILWGKVKESFNREIMSELSLRVSENMSDGEREKNILFLFFPPF